MPTLQDPHLNDLYEQIDAIKDHARQVAAGLTPDQLRWQPARKAWSVGQCLEHLCVSASLYCDRMAPAIARADKTHEPTRWRPTFLGRVLIKSVTTSRRVKGPGVFRPPAQPAADVLERFLESQDRLAQLMIEADGVDLGRVKVSSPVGRWFRLNLGDCFVILVLHSKRHLKQAARVAESRRLPRPATNDGRRLT